MCTQEMRYVVRHCARYVSFVSYINFNDEKINAYYFTSIS